jgi:hypothetical protein
MCNLKSFDRKILCDGCKKNNIYKEKCGISYSENKVF